MAGGIQPGTEAGSKESKKLDHDVRMVAQAIALAQKQYYYEPGHRNLTSDRINESVRNAACLPECANQGITLGCVPDGGMWFDGDRTVMNRRLKYVFEAKYQKKVGNAIERWSTNHDICRKIGPDCQYVTLATGPGAEPGEVVHRHGTNMEIIHGKKVKWHYAPDGFSREEIFEIMKSTLELDDLKFDDIKPYLDHRVQRSHFLNLFEEIPTPQELVAEMLVKQQLIQVDEQFIEILKNARDPMTHNWFRLGRDDKAEAKDLALEMLAQGHTTQQIAEAFDANFVLTVNPRLNT